jgi:large subunit ribosomal protein L7/L12
MSEHNRLTLLGSFAFLLLGASAHAATVHLVSGEVVEPDGLNEGDGLGPGDTVRTGADGVVMIEYRWGSDVPGYDCQRLEIFGYGASHTVAAVELPGQCATRVAASVPDSGAFSTTATRYGDASYDDPNTPAKVRNSWTQSRELDRWMRNAERTYTGKVEFISNRDIDIKGARSGSAKTFSLSASALSGHSDRNALVGKNVRVTYRANGFRPEAIRIEVPGAAAVAQPFVVMQVDPQVFQPGGVATPDPEPDPAPETAQPAPKPQTWRCKVDLHQGDVGTIELHRAGEKIRGAMYIERIDSKHAISGSWKGDRIEFWRTLSSSSSQPFTGTASKTSDNTVAMAGRFANQYSGVWSADCKRVVSTAGAAASPVGAAGQYELVLTGYEGNKIVAIKSVREVSGMGLKESKDAVEQPPSRVVSNLSEEEARRLAEKLMADGVIVRIQVQ